MNPPTTSYASEFSRRRFIHGAAAAGVAVAASLERGHGVAAEPGPRRLIDTNVTLGQWPFRHSAYGSAEALVKKLKSQAVAQAWAGSVEALLHKDISGVNERLAEACATSEGGLLVPMGALNPMLPGWEEDLRRIAEVHKMPGLRLYPNYHGYKLGDAIFEQVLRLATEHRLLIQISVIMEEERTIHPLVNVPATDVSPLPALLSKCAGARVQLLNAFRTLRGLAVQSLAKHGVSFEIAMLEGVSGISTLLQTLPTELLCFGSHSPLFYFESAKLKLQESDLSEAQLQAICADNAQRLLTHS